jgi:hypothetical protein
MGSADAGYSDQFYDQLQLDGDISKINGELYDAPLTLQ